MKKILSRSVVKNILSLSLSQAGNYILPLVTIPYLTQVLGAEKYGVISFAQVTIGYLTIIINYGFDLTVTREIALNRESREKTAEIFSNTIYTKAFLFLFSTLLLFLLLCIDTFNSHKMLLLLTHGINIGFVLFPSWFFQGMEKLSFTALLNFIIKLIFTVSVFFFIHSPEDFLLTNLFLSAAQMIVGVAGIVLAMRLYRIYFTRISWEKMAYLIKNGLWMFLSMSIITLYTSTNIFLLGLLTDDRQVGLFNVVYKIIFAIHGILLLPFNLSFFPHITRQFHQDPGPATRQLYKAAGYLLAVTLACGIVIYFFAGIILSVFGKDYKECIPVLQTLSVIPSIMGMVNVFGFNGLVALKKDKSFLLVTSIGAVVSISSSLVLLP